MWEATLAWALGSSAMCRPQQCEFEDAETDFVSCRNRGHLLGTLDMADGSGKIEVGAEGQGNTNLPGTPLSWGLLVK